MYLWPRLGPASHTDLLERLKTNTPEELRAAATTAPHPDTTWYPTGQRAPDTIIVSTAEQIRSAAERQGWPDTGVGDNARRAFDQQLAGPLHDTMAIVPADATHPGVWANLALVIAPDVARWRYPDHKPERYLSTHRNVYGRLWWRAHRLGSDPDDPPARLLEDQAVGLLERSSLGGRPELATVLAEAVLNHPANSQDLLREAAIRVRRQLAVVEVSVLGEHELRDLVTSAVENAATSDRVAGAHVDI